MPKRRSRNPTDTGVVRIIGGQYRSRQLPVLSVEGLRPSGDRLRETLFNWLQYELPGARCLDAFAGTGALGFEAASRYAASVTLVESHRSVAAELENTRAQLAADHVTVVNRRFEAFAAMHPEPFDLVFVDPPFHTADFAAVLATADSLLAPAGWLYLECPKQQSDARLSVPSTWTTLRDKVFGDVRARLYQRTEPTPVPVAG